MGKHFIQMLSVETLPHPAIEVARVLEVSALEDGTPVWFGVPRMRAWAPEDSPAWCIVFYRLGGERIGGFVAEVVSHQAEMPDADWLRELYAGTTLYGAWWRLEGVVPLPAGATLAALPGYSSSGLLAEGTFAGRNSFAYWNFDKDPRTSLLAYVPAPSPPTPLPSTAILKSPSRRRRSAAVAGDALVLEPLDRPSGRALHGVDFSGAAETRAGNPKVWVASWDPEHSDGVQLMCGRDRGLRRRDLPDMVRTRGGVWVMDFPFGVARDTSRALGLADNDWGAWLRWASEDRGTSYAPTELRDLARALTASAGVAWSTCREVDEAHGTTWFPLFEQLYRQTLFGAREVLAPLAKDASVVVVPFHAPRPGTTLVSEGFPGWTLRRRLGHPGTGYKGKTVEHRRAREGILRSLVAAGLPVGDADRARAVEDTEGDAVDALTLLLASWETSAVTANTWAERHTKAAAAGRLAEGWFIA